MNKKCECNIDSFVEKERRHEYSKEEKAGMNHKAGKCKGTYKMEKYIRDGKEILLCNCCWFSGEEKITLKK